jgi:hypothetical protein
MPIEIDLTGVEPWKGGDILPAGGHDVVCVEAGEGTSSGGHYQLELTWAAYTGEHQGAQLRDWVHVTEQTLGKVVQLLTAVGIPLPQGRFTLAPQPFLGKRCHIVARDRPKPDGTPKTDIVAYEPLATNNQAAPFGQPTPAPAQATFGGAPVGQPTSAVGQGDADIPF